MKRDAVQTLFEIAVTVVVIAAMVALVVISTAVEPERYGAGPALRRALDEGWRPTAPTKTSASR